MSSRHRETGTVGKEDGDDKKRETIKRRAVRRNLGRKEPGRPGTSEEERRMKTPGNKTSITSTHRPTRSPTPSGLMKVPGTPSGGTWNRLDSLSEIT